MDVFFDTAQQKHNPKAFLVAGTLQQSPEQPARADHLLEAARRSGLAHRIPDEHGLAPIAAVHTPEYVTFLATIHGRWRQIDGASEEVLANIHPDRRDGSYPQSAVGQAGYHMADTACPIGAETWPAVRRSADAATAAALTVLDGAGASYALCRPPGHHAFADRAGGFCFVNNTAVAASVLRSRHQRVAVLDVDLHHGNGTQGIFYDRADVMTVSVHADPNQFYPFFWGHANERGAGSGLGYNFNLPIALGTGDEAYLQVLDVALERIGMFSAGALVVALGLDSRAGDPFGGLAVSTDGYARIGEAVGKLGLPTVLVQEGGYLSDDLGATLQRFLDGFTLAHRATGA